jgi:hypothetical protein
MAPGGIGEVSRKTEEPLGMTRRGRREFAFRLRLAARAVVLPVVVGLVVVGAAFIGTVLVGTVFVGIGVAPASAAEAELGAPEGLRAAWDRTYSVAKEGTSLRQAVEGLARDSGMAVVLDRRADPERLVTIDAQDVPLGQIWTDLAASCGLRVSWVGSVVYLGPPEAATELRTLAALRRDEAAKLPPDLRLALAAKKSVSWTDLEEPRSLLASWTAEAGLRLAGDGVPHDLWPAARWPALSLVDRLTLLAIGFDRTFVVDPVSRTLTLTPIPAAVAIERIYPAPPNAADTVRRWQGLAPQASVRLVGNQLVVVGREEDHEAIATGRARRVVPGAVTPAQAGTATSSTAPSSMSPSGTSTSGTSPSGTAAKPPGTGRAKLPAGTKVFTLRALEQPLAAIVDALRRQGNDVRMDEAALKRAGIDPAGRTSVEVKEATLVELLEAAGRPLRLTARQVGKAVELVPRP